MSRCLHLLLVIIFLFTVDSAKLPSYIKKCSRSDPNIAECIKSQSDYVISKMLDGVPSLKIPKLNPFHITKISVQALDNLEVNLENVDVYGLNNTKLTAFKPNFSSQRAYGSIFFDKLFIKGEYDINGKVMVLPIVGHGPAQLTLYNLSIQSNFSWEVVKNKQGIEYLNLIDPEFDYSIQDGEYKLENLLNGNKEIGDQINKFLNENWKDFVDELKPAVFSTLRIFIESIFGIMWRSIPVDDLFLP